MRFTTFSSMVGLTFTILLLHATNHIVIAGWPSNMGKEDKLRMKNMLGGRLAIPADMAYFVKYKDATGKRLAKSIARGNKFDKHVKELKLAALHTNNRTALKELAINQHIDFVEPQRRIHALPAIGKHKRGKARKARQLEESVEYGVKMVQADLLWDLSPIKYDTTICIIDSGYALGHPDLPNLENNVTGSSGETGDWSEDLFGHGTHCAGVIGAIGNNDVGVAGVIKDPNRFKFHIGKSLDSSGDGSEADMLDAFRSCMAAGAQVISMSIGSNEYSQAIHDVCKDAYDKGVLLVAAAGNDGGTSYSYPASFPEVISVAAVGREGKVAGFSQYNDQVEIAGPGVDILSTVTTNYGQSNGYDTWTGTSMAAPHVAAVSAAVWSYFPECTNNQIRNVLLRTAKDATNVGCTEDLGFGIVQAKDAYDLLTKEGCIAGDLSPAPLSSGAIGGCEQDPSYVPPLTPAPTPFTCIERAFILELMTDEWAEETSWELTDSNNKVVGSGSGFRNSKTYVENLCLPQDEYTFTIRDSEGDGICCDFGAGEFSISYDGVLVKNGGNFTKEDLVRFGEVQTVRTKAEIPKGCMDDNSWVFTTAGGKQKGCNYVGINPSKRCTLRGVDSSGTLVRAYGSCQATCGTCSKSESARPQGPTFVPTPQPTLLATTPPTSISPTTADTALPTSEPTLATTTQPTASLATTTQPTPSPTLTPTTYPSHSPTLSPTSAPTVQPTPPPSTEPTMYPSFSPTLPPTLAPTMQPTSLPTSTPTTYPSHSPTFPPTLAPTMHPTSSPTSTPTSAPTIQPSPAPSQALTIPPTSAQNPTPHPSLSPSLHPMQSPSTPSHTYYPTPASETSTRDKTIPSTAIPTSIPTMPPTTSQPTTLLITPLPTDSPFSTYPPILAGRKNAFVCQDDVKWVSKKNQKWKCKALATKTARCKEEGENRHGDTTLGFQSCPVSCRMCKSGERIETKCKDDKHWVTTRDSSKTCKWVATDRHKHCSKEGTSWGGKTTLGFQSCRKTCGTCLRRQKDNSKSNSWDSK